MDVNRQYQHELHQAVSRTQREGYEYESTYVKSLGSKDAYFNEATYRDFMQPFVEAYSKQNGNFDLSAIKGRCLEIHAYMQKELLRRHQLNVLLTVGYVTKLGQDMFKFDSISTLPRRLTMEGKPSLNYHAWLTLPSWEIIDYTFIAHFEYTNSPPEVQKLLQDAPSFVANFGDASAILAEEHMIYHPLYVGNDVLAKNGIIVQSVSP